MVWSTVTHCLVTWLILWFYIDWVDTSREKALASGDPAFVYVSEKTLAEQAVWDFAEKHPNIDVTSGGSRHFVIQSSRS